ncbi:hypothetical protein KIL84_012178, partial [Mauremys mutica]
MTGWPDRSDGDRTSRQDQMSVFSVSREEAVVRYVELQSWWEKYRPDQLSQSDHP